MAGLSGDCGMLLAPQRVPNGARPLALNLMLNSTAMGFIQATPPPQPTSNCVYLLLCLFVCLFFLLDFAPQQQQQHGGGALRFLTSNHFMAVGTTIVNQRLTRDTKELLEADLTDQDVRTTLDAVVLAIARDFASNTQSFERAWLLYVIARLNINRELLGTFEVQEPAGNDNDPNREWEEGDDFPEIAERTGRPLSSMCTRSGF
jgi:hypothetical protein